MCECAGARVCVCVWQMLSVYVRVCVRVWCVCGVCGVWCVYVCVCVIKQVPILKTIGAEGGVCFVFVCVCVCVCALAVRVRECACA